MTPAERSGNDNGVWLCHACSRLVDGNPDSYPPLLLKAWRTAAEDRTRRRMSEGGSAMPLLGPLPWAPGPLIGRDQLLAEVRAAVSVAGSRLTLVGPSGVGKSRVANEVAREVGRIAGVAHRWWCDGTTDATFTSALASLAVAAHLAGILADPPATDAPPTAWVNAAHRLLGDREDLLLVVDNLPGADGLVSLVPDRVRARLLATAIGASAGPQHKTVPSLDPASVVDLLAGLAPGLDPTGLPAVAVGIGGLPLAVSQAAATMLATGLTPQSYLDLLTGGADALLARGAPADHPEPMAAVVRAAMDAALARDPLAAVMRYVVAFMAPVGIRIDEVLHWFDEGGHPRIAAVMTRGSIAASIAIASLEALVDNPDVDSVEALVGDKVAPTRVLDAISLLGRLGLVQVSDGMLTTHDLTNKLIAESAPDSQHDQLRTLAVPLTFAVMAQTLEGDFGERALAHAAAVDLAIDTVNSPFYDGAMLALVNARKLASLGLSWDVIRACRRGRRRLAPFLDGGDVATELLRRLELPRAKATDLLDHLDLIEAEALRGVADYVAAAELMRRSLAHATSAGDWIMQSRGERQLGAILTGAGQFAAAAEAIDRAVGNTQAYWSAVLDGRTPPPVPAADDGYGYEREDALDECVLARVLLLALLNLTGRTTNRDALAAELARVPLSSERRTSLNAAVAQAVDGPPSIADAVDGLANDHEEALHDPDRRRRFQTGTALGLALDDAGRVEEARSTMVDNRALARALFGDVHPEVALLGRHLGRVLGRLGELDEARITLAHARKALGSEPGDVSIRRERLLIRATEVWIETTIGDAHEARRLAELAMADPDIGTLLEDQTTIWLRSVAAGDD